MRQAMPLLDNIFRNNKDEVQSLLKNLQLSTRTLHHMCSHSKVIFENIKEVIGDV